MKILNPTRTRNLTTVPKDPYTWAKLIPEDPKIPTYEFLINPSTIDTQISASYGENPTLGTNTQRQQYFNSSGKGFSLSEIILITPCQDKSIRPLMEGLESLTRCDPENRVFQTPVLSFFWSRRREDNLVLTAVNFTETGWRGGIPTRATGTLTFLRVPPKESATTSTTATSQTTTASLTERQQSEGSAKGSEWLKANLAKLKQPIQSLVKSNSYLMDTATSGVVSVLDNTRKNLGTVGQYDGKTLDTSKNTVAK